MDRGLVGDGKSSGTGLGGARVTDVRRLRPAPPAGGMAAAAHLRRLSNLGLEPRQAIGAMLGELPGIVPDTRAVFGWVDPNGVATDLLVPEVISSVVDVFFDEHQRFVGAEEPSMERSAFLPGPYARLSEAFGAEAVERSNTHQIVFRHYRMGHMTSVPVRQGGRTIAVMGCYRDFDDPPFSDQECAALAGLTPYLRQAMASIDADWDTVESDDCGAVICDAEGRVLGQTSAGLRLMTYAVNERFGLALGRPYIPSARLPDLLLPICRAAALIEQGREAPPPRLSLRNSWGRFEVAIQPLSPGAAPAHFCVLISRRQPLPLRIAIRLKDEPLTERQKQIALHLALDRPVEEICERMGISAHTYRDHVRAVYARLGVSRRGEIVVRLLN